MHTLDTRVATGVFDPGNPSQRSEIYYAGWPGQYASFYTNGVPTTASVNLGHPQGPKCPPHCWPSGASCKCPPPKPRTLRGVGLGGFASWSPLAQAATIGALAIGTYFATKRLRTKGLLGGRRRRRR